MPPGSRPTLTLLLCSMLAACATESQEATPEIRASGEVRTVALGAGSGPSVTITAPSNNTIVLYEEAGLDIEVAFQVANTTIGAGGHLVQTYLDGAPLSCGEETETVTFTSVPFGRRQLGVRLVTETCEGLPNPTSLDTVVVKILAGCVDPGDCEDGLECSAHNCTSNTCNYGPVSPCCDHDLECPYGWVCDAGACVECLDAGYCDDGNPCTDDVCLEDQICTNTLIVGCCAVDGDGCDDGEICTDGDTCDGGTCVGGPALDCEDGNVCTDDDCTVGVGCTQTPSTSDCDDGNACTVDDVCADGVCTGTPGFCDGGDAGISILSPTNNAIIETDQEKETFTVQVEVNQVVIGSDTFHVAWFLDGAQIHQQETTAPFDYVDITTGRHHVGARIVTPEGEALESADSLDGIYVQIRSPCEDETTCEDGLQCSNHACSSGVCKYGPVNGCCDHDLECPYLWVCVGNACIECFGDGDCNDFNPCTIDACDATSTCATTFIAGCCLQDGDCDDDDACTIDSCDGSNDCVFTDNSDSCQGGNPCKSYSCDINLGCQQSNLDIPCDDGDACTLNDTCQGGVCQGGAGTLPCDDSNACTDDACDPATGCVLVNNEAPCDDQDACTVGDACQEGSCAAGIPQQCTDQNPCTNDACDTAHGCVFSPNTAPCEDGSVCTLDDTCHDGDCVAGQALACADANLCTNDGCDAEKGCVFPANNAPCDDGDACTDGDQCAAGGCKAGSVVTCIDASPCTDAACDSATGCAFASLEGPCSDGDPCTTADSCADGVCVPGVPADCDDLNPCTQDSCDPSSGCVYTAEEAGGTCEDGNACTVDDQCSGTACVGIPLVECEDDNPCTYDTCNSDLGCTFTPNTNPCDDQDICTITDTCQGGTCVGSLPPCNDFNPCTDDACEPGVGCTHATNSTACSDGDACTANDTCVDTQCVPGDPVDCDDQNPCTDDACDGAGGCTYNANQVPCDDGDACTENDTCLDGGCASGGPVNCDDDNPCTDQLCDSATGCSFTFGNATSCDDNNACSVDDICLGGVCVGDPVLDCDDENPCTLDLCDPSVGCIGTPNQAPCDDGNLCSTGDSCKLGVCEGTTFLNCDDDNACTLDACLPTEGCINENIEGPCDDGDACTTGDSCGDGLCLFDAVLDCDDQNLCTDEVCDFASGCVYSFNSLPCDDGSLCATGDECFGGVCIAQGKMDCDDQNPCTDDVCEVSAGCLHSPNLDSCDDGDPCTLGDTCVGGICVQGNAIDCDDFNPCTDDLCESGVGCANTPNMELCDDGNPCTDDDHCTLGICISGSPVDCEDGNPCTDHSCDPLAGCQTVANHAGCDDGSLCTVGDRCFNAVCKSGSNRDCDDSDPCTDDGCDPETGCISTPGDGPCEDGNACTENDLCVTGICTSGQPRNCNDDEPCTIDSCDEGGACVHLWREPCDPVQPDVAEDTTIPEEDTVGPDDPEPSSVNFQPARNEGCGCKTADGRLPPDGILGALLALAYLMLLKRRKRRWSPQQP